MREAAEGDTICNMQQADPIGLPRDENNVQHQMMQAGRAVFSFSGRYDDNNGTFRFATLVCFDWVSTIAGKKPWAWLLESLHNQALAHGGQSSLTWLFNIQHNPKPSHATFLGEVQPFFDHSHYPSARRESTCVVFANSAGESQPGFVRSHGQSSLIFYQNPLIDTPPANFTHNNGGQRVRQSNLIHPHIDVLFRESGACIHSFGLNNPAAMVAGAGNRAKALNEPYVFPLVAGSTQPRAPGNVVAAAVKWFNDALDRLPTLAAHYQHQPLAQAVSPVHTAINTALRAKDASGVRDLMKHAVVESTAEHADEWDETEFQSLGHVVNTLDIFGVGYPSLSAAVTAFHAHLEIQAKSVDLVAVHGKSHEACVKHLANDGRKLRRHLIVVSRDRDNTSMLGRRTSILTPRRATINTQINYSDPSTALVYIGYGDVLQHFLNSNNPAELEAALRASLS